MRTRHVIVGLLIATPAMVLALTGQRGRTGDDTPQAFGFVAGSSNGDSVEAVAEPVGVPPDKAGEIDLSRDPAAFLDGVRQRLGARWGGGWIVPGAAPEVHVAVKGLGAGDERLVHQLATKFAIPLSRVRLESVTHSYDELLAAYDRVVASLDTVDLGQSSYAITSVDVEQNRVVLESPSIDIGVRVQLADVAGDELLEFEEGVMGLEAEPATSRSDYPPYKAGLKVDDSSTPYVGFYTTGFTMKSNSSGLWQGSTAGHCTDILTTLKAGNGATIGVSNMNAFAPYNTSASNGDAVLIGFSSQSHATNDLYVTSSYTRDVTSKLG